MKKIIALLSVMMLAVSLMLMTSVFAASPSRPSILVPSGGKEMILQKIENNEWAQRIVQSAHESCDKYVDIHQTDPEWIISRIQKYWKHKYTTPYLNGGYYSRAEGEAPVPTVRFTGARDWATDHAQPAIEDIKPYMDYNDDQMWLQNIKKPDQPWEWVDNAKTAHHIELINVDIMTRAMHSAFLYWLTGEEKYAKFAHDILVDYTEALYYLNPPVTEIDHRNAHLVGITSFEVIHEKIVDPMTLCYDFLYSYLVEQKADLDRIAAVYQKLADQIVLNGVPHNNWNIFQARYITYLALALESDDQYDNGKGREYYIDLILNQNSERQKSLRDVCFTYDQETGIWPESPSYSNSVSRDMMEIMQMIDNERSDNIFKEFPIVEKAALATFQYLFPNNRMTAFGDSGYQTLSIPTLEMMLAFYRKYGEKEKEAIITTALEQLIDEGAYNRERGGSIYKLFMYVDKLDPAMRTDLVLHTPTFYAPNVNLFIQRNGMDRQHGLMAVNAGTGFNHDHWNGLNLELYGKGYPLGLDFAAGTSYWVPDHNQFYARSVSHNTVIVDGISTNGRGEDNHKLLGSYPMPGDNAPLFGDVTYGLNSYTEPKTLANQVRLNSIVRTSPTTGYYVDIFWSRKPTKDDIVHEYFYHNIGQSLTVFDTDGTKIPFSPTVELNSDEGRLKGYDYFFDKTSAEYNNDFKVRFTVDIKNAPSVNMEVWMKGYPGRELFAIKGPRSLKAFRDGVLPIQIDTLPVPALVVRQYGEAWNRPFVAIYEPYTSAEGASVLAVDYLPLKNIDNAIALAVTSKADKKEYIFAANTRNVSASIKGYAFTGTYGVAGTEHDKLSSLFLGKGSIILSEAGYALGGQSGDLTAMLLIKGDALSVTADQPFVLSVPYQKGAEVTCYYTDQKGVSGQAEGRAVKIKGGPKVMQFMLPALSQADLNIR